MQCLTETIDSGDVAGIFSLVFTQLARFAKERPRFGDLDGKQLDHDVERLHSRKIIGEMSAYAKRRDALVGRISLQLYGPIRVESIAEDHLF